MPDDPRAKLQAFLNAELPIAKSLLIEVQKELPRLKEEVAELKRQLDKLAARKGLFRNQDKINELNAAYLSGSKQIKALEWFQNGAERSYIYWSDPKRLEEVTAELLVGRDHKPQDLPAIQYWIRHRGYIVRKPDVALQSAHQLARRFDDIEFVNHECCHRYRQLLRDQVEMGFYETLKNWAPQDQAAELQKRTQELAEVKRHFADTPEWFHPVIHTDIAFLERYIAKLLALINNPLPPPKLQIGDNVSTFRLLTSNDDPLTRDHFQQFLLALARLNPPQIIFSLAGLGQEQVIVPTFTVPNAFAETFEHQFQVFFPSSQLEPSTYPPLSADVLHTVYCIMPTSGSLELLNLQQADPFRLFCGTFEQLRPDEAVLFTIAFNPSAAVPSIYCSEKTRQPDLWSAVIQLSIDSPSTERREHLLSALQQHLAQFTCYDSDGKMIGQLQPFDRWEFAEDLFRRYCNRPDPTQHQSNVSPIEDLRCLPAELWHQSVVNTQELTSFVHLPHKSVTSRLLVRANMQSQKAPDELTQPAGLLVGTNEYRRQVKNVYLPQSVRSRHMYLLGASGSGKSTLMANLIKQDIDAGAGLALIDPHGDLVKQLLPLIPERRIKDGILFNAADVDHPIALNPLDARSLAEQEQVRDEFMVLFQRLFVTGDAPRMLHILRFVITTLVQAGGKTFFDIRRLLINSDYRRNVLAGITDPFVLEFWSDEFPAFPKGATDPITNKLSQFTLSTCVRGILGQAQTRLNFSDLMQRRKILLASVPPDIGEENSHLLGSLLVSQIQLAAMRRSAIPPEQRVPFTLYVDEFQNFMSSAFEKILSEARKYNLSLVIGHQYTSQLDDSVRQAIFANTHTRIFFRISPHDANAVRSIVGNYTPDQLTTLGRGQAVAALSGSAPFSLTTLPPPQPPTVDFTEAIIEQSRSHYSTTATPQPQATPAPAAAIAPEPNAPPAPEPPKPKERAASAGNLFDDLLGNQ